MHNTGIFTMSSQELTRKELLDRVINREISQVKAAKKLNISDRWLRKLLFKYKQAGVAALISKKRGKKSNRAYKEEFKLKVINLVKQKYHDFGPTFAAEKLEEYDGIKINHETLRLWMIEDGMHIVKSKRKARIHQSRERRSCVGELIQIDGSHHDWFEGRADKCCLLVFVDDSSSSLMYARFEQAETTNGYLKATKDYIMTYGIPMAFYSDKHSIFRVNQSSSEAKTSQFQRATKELGIDLICAHSPQAKGRIERANGTLQKRLIKEMRLRNISGIEAANKFLPEFIATYNKKFAVPPKKTHNSHVEVTGSQEKLDYILSVREKRILSKNLECSFNNMCIQIITKTRGYRLRHAAVTISTTPDGKIRVCHKGEKLDFKIRTKQQKTNVVDYKGLILKSGLNRALSNSNPWGSHNPAEITVSA